MQNLVQLVNVAVEVVRQPQQPTLKTRCLLATLENRLSCEELGQDASDGPDVDRRTLQPQMLDYGFIYSCA